VISWVCAEHARAIATVACDAKSHALSELPDWRYGESPVNTELIQIANQAPRPFPPFKDANGEPVGEAQAQAVQKFLGGPDVTRLCSVTAPVCNIRESYYQSYEAPWSSIQVDLTNAEVGCSEPREGFTVAQCQGIRAQLLKEVSMVAEVQQYFGPLGLQQPFGATGVAALANVTEIAQQIKDAVSRLPWTTRPRPTSP
jgi:hypothetical protein